MDDIAARIRELMISKIGAAMSQKLAQKIADDSKDSEADMVALEVCNTIFRERGVIVNQPRLAKAASRIIERRRKAEDDKDDRIAEIRMAVGANGIGGSLKQVAGAVFASSDWAKTLDTRPISHDDVCRACSQSNPSNISFLRYRAKGLPAAARLQVAKTRKLVERRLMSLGVSGEIDVSVVIHRGCCKVHGSSERRSGDGVAEIPGVLMRVDFGNGVAIEGEHEVCSAFDDIE